MDLQLGITRAEEGVTARTIARRRFRSQDGQPRPAPPLPYRRVLLSRLSEPKLPPSLFRYEADNLRKHEKIGTAYAD